MVEAFKNLLSDLGEWRASLMGLEFSSINDYEAASLERPFAEEEIKAAPFDMSVDEARVQMVSQQLSSSVIGIL